MTLTNCFSYFLSDYFVFLFCIETKKEHVAQNACLTACRHIAEILMDLLLSDDVKSISMGALQQVNLDVIQCERNSLITYILSWFSCYSFSFLTLFFFSTQNSPLQNLYPDSRTGPYCRPFWTCASYSICCCPGTGRLTFTIMARTLASTFVFPPSERLPFWKSKFYCRLLTCSFLFVLVYLFNLCSLF